MTGSVPRAAYRAIATCCGLCTTSFEVALGERVACMEWGHHKNHKGYFWEPVSEAVVKHAATLDVAGTVLSGGVVRSERPHPPRRLLRRHQGCRTTTSSVVGQLPYTPADLRLRKCLHVHALLSYSTA